MIHLELTAMAIVAIYVVARARLAADGRRFLARLGWLVLASWVAEETAIRAYGFYAYSPEWTVFVGHVPLAVILIWPGVIHSAWDTSRYLLRRTPRRRTATGASQAAPRSVAGFALVGALFVLADASLIEPISVCAGLWHWNEPGLFAVPPIGILGWAFHAGWSQAVFEHNDRRGRSAWADGAIALVSPVGTHALLLATWWGALRWVNTAIEPWSVVGTVWVISIVLAVVALRTRARLRIPQAEMWTRVPAALFFFVLLARYGGAQPALVAYALAFAPPYLALTRLPRALRSTAPSRSGTL